MIGLFIKEKDEEKSLNVQQSPELAPNTEKVSEKIYLLRR